MMSQQMCQSCGMPLHNEELLGTDSAGNKVAEYCTYCYERGAFRQPDLTLAEMIEQCVPFMMREGMDEHAAKTMLAGYLPHLKRWSAAGTQGEAIQPDKIVEKSSFRVAGISARTSNAREMSADAQIYKLWQRFWDESIQRQIATLKDSDVLYGCYTDYENGAFGDYTLVIGSSTMAPSADFPAELSVTTIPAARYAVFTSKRGRISQIVPETWQAIWRWAAASGVERTFTGDFELYDERSADPTDAVVDIYVAIG